MPQVQTGQIQPGVAGAPKLYGTEKPTNLIPFQQRLMDLFKPQEFVTIKNIDTDPCYWQYQPLDSEQEFFDESGYQKMIVRENPEMWVIMPGETEVVVGASAYRALDVMYKNVMANKTLNRYSDPTSRQFDEKGAHLPKNFNFSDTAAQDLFIQQAYLGKATPSFFNQAPVEQPAMPIAAAPVAPGAPRPHPTQPNSTPPNGVPQTPPQPIAAVPPAPVVAQPMVVAEPLDDPTIPKPKTTEGAPLAPVTYADPDNEGKPGILSVATSIDNGQAAN